MAKDYYDILGVAKNASTDDIKKAYRKLAHQFHPDKQNGGDESKFKEVNEAYQVLGNEQKRKQYDQFGQTFGSAGQQGAGGFSWQDFARANQQGDFGGFNGQSVDFDFGDLFGDLFGFGGGSRSRKRSQANKGADTTAEISISLLEAVTGTEKQFSLKHYIVCDRCHGNGAEPGTKITDCKTCGGAGEVQQVQQTVFGQFATRVVCPTCHGEGKQITEKCSRCRGEGRIRQESVITVKIPAGIADGEQIRLSGKGEAGKKGSASGDLYLAVHVLNDERFTRKGDDIVSVILISISDAVLGTTVDVETVEGPVSLKIPSGTEAGKVFILRNKGVPHLRSRGKGDHLVTVEIEIPKRLSRDEKRLFEQLREA